MPLVRQACAVERDQADLGGGLIAAAATDQDGSVDEWQFVVFLQEDDEAVGQFDASRLLRLECVQRRDRDLGPGLGWEWLRGQAAGRISRPVSVPTPIRRLRSLRPA